MRQRSHYKGHSLHCLTLCIYPACLHSNTLYRISLRYITLHSIESATHFILMRVIPVYSSFIFPLVLTFQMTVSSSSMTQLLKKKIVWIKKSMALNTEQNHTKVLKTFPDMSQHLGSCKAAGGQRVPIFLVLLSAGRGKEAPTSPVTIKAMMWCRESGFSPFVKVSESTVYYPTVYLSI